MGWEIGFDSKWNRDIGYGVPAYCDHPDCMEEIDRGLSYVCGSEPYGGEYGCGLYFCGKHLYMSAHNTRRCARCHYYKKTYFIPKREHPKWIDWKLNEESWEKWRQENPEEVQKLIKQLNTIFLTRKEYDAFRKLLDEPPKINERMQRLLTTPGFFDSSN